MGLETRDRFAELMDQPGLDEAAHRQALRGLARLNRVSRSAAVLWGAMRNQAEAAAKQGRRLRVLDVACGGGDVTVGLWQRAEAAVELVGCDMSETALAVAEEMARRAGADVAWQRCDAVNEPMGGGYDVAVCSLFMHHLEAEDAATVLGKMGRAAERVLVSDLVRSPAGYAAAWAATRVLSRSGIVHVDGPLSVRGAFTPRELKELAERAGLHGARVRRCFPQRMLLDWRRG